jgi:integrase
MASIFKMTGKPFWYLRYKDKETGEWRKSSTGLRHDDPNDTAKARQLRADAESAEFRASPLIKSGWEWVDRYIATSGLAANSKVRYVGAWAWVQMFLQEFRLDVLSVRYSNVEDYIVWRIGRKKRSGKRAGRNTAIQEVKILQMLLNEAVRRGLVAANPLAALKVKKDEPAKKRAFLPEEITRCREALVEEPEWMRVAFEISLFTGCRLRETRIALSDIALDERIPTITFAAPKGGTKVAFSVPCPTPLIELFADMRRRGLTHTIAGFPFGPSRRWQQFFQKMGIEGVCFHCLRVTRITQMRREGVPREVAMRLVNHSSELVHLLYDRHQVQDLAAFADAGNAGLCAAMPQSRSKKPCLKPQGNPDCPTGRARSGTKTRSPS